MKLVVMEMDEKMNWRWSGGRGSNDMCRHGAAILSNFMKFAAIFTLLHLILYQGKMRTMSPRNFQLQ